MKRIWWIVASIAVCVIVVGYGGFILWGIAHHQPLSYSSLRSVDMISPTEGWAVGDTVETPNGVLLHYVDGRWKQVALPLGMRNSDTLTGIAMIDASEGWAIGMSQQSSRQGFRPVGIFVRYEQGTWRVAGSSVPEVLRAIAFLNSSEGWAVGDNGLVVHFDGSQWRMMALPPALSGSYFTSADIISPTDVWLTGGLGTIAHFAGRPFDT